MLSPTVAGECAFGLENLGWKVERMRDMVRRSLSAVGLDIPWNTPTRTLSWRLSYGQTRLLALASVLILHPRILLLDDLIQAATDHVHRYFQEGSDPGLCIDCEADKSPVLENFGRLCSAEIVTQKQAFAAGSNIHLSGHGGTNDGIIGALAAVGLTMSGWGGSFIDYADIRNLPSRISIQELQERGIKPVAAMRKGLAPHDRQKLIAPRGIRPRLWGGYPVLPLLQNNNLDWEPIDWKKKNIHG